MLSSYLIVRAHLRLQIDSQSPSVTHILFVPVPTPCPPLVLSIVDRRFRPCRKESPNSFPLTLLVDPHPLNLVASIFYRNIGGWGLLNSSNFQPSTFDSRPLPSTHCPPKLFRINTCVGCKSVSKQRTLTAFRMNTYENYGKKPHFAQFWCSVSPFRMNTCKSVSKQRTLTAFRMNTYEKHGGGGCYG